MSKEKLITGLKRVEKIAAASKVSRLMANPAKYLNAILFRELLYKRNKKEKEVVGKTFFDTEMHLLLPSSTDIYLTGGKSHDSEIRLAKFLINQLREGDTFVDVGAHYGYFSLLAAQLVARAGRVFSFEASPVTYRVLHKNAGGASHMVSHNLAVSNTATPITFYEFPNLYSEYNSMDVAQFENETWFAENQPNEIAIGSVVLGDFLRKNEIVPKVIKIDVEGAEFKVVDGLKRYLAVHSPLVVLEYLSDERGNEPHVRAEKLLESLEYLPHTIDGSGRLSSVENISGYLQTTGLESDNVVFLNKGDSEA